MGKKAKNDQPKDDEFVDRMKKKILLLSPETREIFAWALDQLLAEQEKAERQGKA